MCYVSSKRSDIMEGLAQLGVFLLTKSYRRIVSGLLVQIGGHGLHPIGFIFPIGRH